jgi:hypothetical protein
MILCGVAFLGTVGLAMAQDANGKNPAMSPKARLQRQHKRIKKGVKNGTITPAEHKQLAQEGKDINQQRKADLKKDGGKLTKKDRDSLEAQENLRSKQINQDKHPNGTAPVGGVAPAGN